LAEVTLPALIPTRNHRSENPPLPAPRLDLSFYNGLGYGSPGWPQVCRYRHSEQLTPAQWFNVLANPQFGAALSNSIAGMKIVPPI
jgi:cyclic beta-1,2-glucan synthetase